MTVNILGKAASFMFVFLLKLNIDCDLQNNFLDKGWTVYCIPTVSGCENKYDLAFRRAGVSCLELLL